MNTKDTIQAKAIAAIGDQPRAGIEASMGVGKTKIGLEHMAINYTPARKYLVVAPRVKIFTGWIEDMRKFDLLHLEDHIDYSTYRSLPKQGLDYDVIYLDECHSLKATHNEWLKRYVANGGRIVGLTGTYPIRATSEKGKMCNFYCPRVFTYKVDDAVADHILNDYRIVVHELYLNRKLNIDKTGPHGDWKTSEFKDYMFWTKRLESVAGVEEQKIRIQRMKAMQSYKTKELYAKPLFEVQVDKAIIFANTQKQADHLCEHSVHSANTHSDDNLDAFKKGYIQKLSAVDQLNEGVTIPDLKNGIIMHSYSNNRKAAQKIGRFLRLNPNDTSTIHILCYADTVDKKWVKEALKDFDQSKITWVQGSDYETI